MGRVVTTRAASGTGSLTFTYVVSAGAKTHLNLDYASTGALTLNGGGIQDLAACSRVDLPPTGPMASTNQKRCRRHYGALL